MKRLIIIASCIFLSQISNAQVMMFFTKDSLSYITSPLDLDSLFYWFAADVGVTDSLGGAIATDEGVGQWNDLSGNGYHVTQGTNGARPVYKATGGPGSKPTIQFDGTNDFLASAAHWWGSDDLTVFVVMKFANATRNAIEIISARETTATTRQFLFYGANTVGAYKGYTRAYEASSPSVLNFQNTTPANWKHINWKVHAWTNNGDGTMNFYSDGASVSMTDDASTGNGTIANLSQEFQVGAQRVPANSFLQGSISEIIIYSRALTATERAAIENYLNKKYDLY